MLSPDKLAVLSRMGLAGDLGLAYGGKRDYYRVLGYRQTLVPEDYLRRYQRQDIAARINDLPAQDTWRRSPIIYDEGGRSDEQQPGSQFIQEWKNLADRLRVFHYLERADRLTGLGRFGLLLIGVRDDLRLDQPFAGGLTGPEDILFLRPIRETGSGQDLALEKDPQNPRFGLPAYYNVDLGEDLGLANVHWTRVIHIAEDLLDDDVYGQPRLERIFNRLDDLEKIVGGSAEATWKLMRKGLAIVSREGYKPLTDNDAALAEFRQQIEDYDHGLRRILRLAGMDIQELGSEVVDPRGMFEIILSLISAASGIPQRILTGSERGELASSQDAANWAGQIKSRQTRFAEPVILRPFIDWCRRAGALPEPEGGEYSVEWSSLFEANDLEKAQWADQAASTLEKIIAATGAVDIVLPEEIREKILSQFGFSPQMPGGLLEADDETDVERRIFREIQDGSEFQD